MFNGNLIESRKKVSTPNGTRSLSARGAHRQRRAPLKKAATRLGKSARRIQFADEVQPVAEGSITSPRQLSPRPLLPALPVPDLVRPAVDAESVPTIEPKLAVETSREAAESTPGAPDAVASSLSAYLREVGVVPLLTREEEVELAARIRRGDESAREHMIRANLRLVVKIARDYEQLGLPLVDLISEGTIGLMKAVDRFDPAKGGKLSTYGSWWIKQQIRRALANQGRTIRLPVHVEAKIYRLGRAEFKLRELLGRDATDEELAEEMGMSLRRVARLRSAALRASSLDAPTGEDQSSTVGELVGDEKATTPYEALEQSADHVVLRGYLEKLPEREAEILRQRFGLDGGDERTLEELGERFGLTRERIRQLQNEAFAKLRAMIERPEKERLAA